MCPMCLCVSKKNDLFVIYSLPNKIVRFLLSNLRNYLFFCAKKHMKKVMLSIFVGVITSIASFSQNYKPIIEPCPCMIKVDAKLKTVCGYLVVPENRQNTNGRKVKMPFVFTRQTNQDSTKNVNLQTTGGPGYSTLANVDSIGFDSPFFNYGSIILFDQRGTKKSIPCLDCDGIDEAIRKAYRENLSKDSLVGIAVTNCRKKFVAQGIDLSAYTTIESAADINDLRKALKIESLTLFGLSYSGSLMMTVARNHPEGIKALVLDSPLPSFVNYEEHALSNHNEALNQIFSNLDADSSQSKLFPDLKQRFQRYFTSIKGKTYTMSYQEKGKTQPIKIHYTKDELLDAIIDRIDNDRNQDVPKVIQDLINGQHETYIKEVLDNKFSGDKNLSYGMRLSVYCTEQMAYSDKNLVKKQNDIFPWFSDYPFNNLNHNTCACWQVKPEAPVAKTPVYSTIPALITGGELDPWCRPYYSRLIKRTMPNSQLLIFKNKAHGTGFWSDDADFLKSFLDNPYKLLVSKSKSVVLE
jgi:pimeloyl-ACP methyl ester carboxylesterase